MDNEAEEKSRWSNMPANIVSVSVTWLKMRPPNRISTTASHTWRSPSMLWRRSWVRDIHSITASGCCFAVLCDWLQRHPYTLRSVSRNLFWRGQKKACRPPSGSYRDSTGFAPINQKNILKENLIECHSFCTVQRKEFSAWEFRRTCYFFRTLLMKCTTMNHFFSSVSCCVLVFYY